MHREPDMPRKQRFKPSRKPQSQQQQPAKANVDERQEIHPDDVDVDREKPSQIDAGGSDRSR